MQDKIQDEWSSRSCWSAMREAELNFSLPVGPSHLGSEGLDCLEYLERQWLHVVAPWGEVIFKRTKHFLIILPSLINWSLPARWIIAHRFVDSLLESCFALLLIITSNQFYWRFFGNVLVYNCMQSAVWLSNTFTTLEESESMINNNLCLYQMQWKDHINV